MFQDDALIYSK